LSATTASARGKGEGDKFQIKQKMTNVNWVWRLIYISLTNELISGSKWSILQIWSPYIWSPFFDSFPSDFLLPQKKTILTSSPILSLCEIKKNDTNSTTNDQK
jgi:hypothetical protein